MSQVSQLQRILDVLECPFSAETSNRINDVLFQVKLISWFEDRKIRQLDIGQRSMLKFDNGVTMTEETWANTMNEYLRTIGCPIVWKVRSPESSSISLGNLEALIWMARHSVSLDCNDLDALSHVEMNAASLSSALEGLKSLLAPTDSVTNDVELVRKATQNVKFMTLSTKSDVLQTTSFSSLSKSLTVGDDGPATATGRMISNSSQSSP